MNTKQTELFDIVDENDNPLGYTKPRDQVHADSKDWHRVTGIYVVNNKKQLLCQQRSFKKDSDPGKWQNHFGGHVKAGESYEQNAVIEIEEEIGLHIKEGDLITLGKRKNEAHRHHGMIYAYKWKDGDKVSLNDGEVEQVKWMTIEQFVDLVKSQGREPNIRKEVIEFIEKQ